MTDASSIDKIIESTVRRDKVVVLGSLVIVIVSAWIYVLSGAGMGMSAYEMTKMNIIGGSEGMITPPVWDFGYAGMMIVMWWIMMVAMMLPSAAPMVLLFARMNRKQRNNGNPYIPTSIFASAYLIVWAGFSLVAVALQWGLESIGLLSSMLESTSAILSSFLLIAAGVYQLTSLKQACLLHCRSPLQFILTRWQCGAVGAFRMGMEHGVFCVGCCWFLMGILFFGGIMNLFWIVGLAVYVLLEKTIPISHWVFSVVGVTLIGWGILILVVDKT